MPNNNNSPNLFLRVKSAQVKTPDHTKRRFRLRTKTATAKSPWRTNNSRGHYTMRVKTPHVKKRR
jgi:hypothetical protein